MTSETLHASRVLMGDSLGFHIIFVLFGLTLPILVSWFEFMGIRRKDQKLIDLAHFWSKIMAVLVITGVISGTIIALQMSLVWPGILKFGGEVIGLPFMFETYTFLIEAIFLALYMSTWNSKKIPQTLHWFFGLFIILGSTMSAYAITSVNAWMNLPTGFDIVNGKFQNVDVLQAMFSETALIEFTHSMPGYYLAASLSIVGLYVIKLARLKTKERSTKKHSLDWLIVQRLMLFAALALVFSFVTADLTGKYLARREPVKLAAIEDNYNTGGNQPFIVGGIVAPDGTVSGPYFKIPNALSILAGNSSHTVVKGLNSYPQKERPPTFVRALFNIKLTLIGALVVLVIGYFVVKKWHADWLKRSWLLWPFATVSFFGLIVVELGWMLTEIGRQPWAVRGYVTTEQAVTKTHDITSFGYFFPLSYVVLFAVTVFAIRKIVRENDLTRKGVT